MVDMSAARKIAKSNFKEAKQIHENARLSCNDVKIELEKAKKQVKFLENDLHRAEKRVEEAKCEEEECLIVFEALGGNRWS